MRPSVLILDSEIHLQRILAYHLRREGVMIHCASSVDNAHQLLDEHRIDLIVMEIELNGDRSGFEFADDLRTHHTTADLPIIILSHRSTDSDIRKGNEIGAAAYLTKPFSISNVVRRIQSILEF